MKKIKKLKAYQRILLFIFPYLFTIGLFQYCGGLLSGVDFSTYGSEKSSFQELAIFFSSMLGTFFILWVFMKFIDKKPFIELGFQFKRRSIDLILGFIVGLLVMAIGFIILSYLKEIQITYFNVDYREILISVVFFTMIAVCEEVVFRGYLLGNLMLAYNKYLALIISAIIFAFGHGLNENINWFSTLNLFLAGLFLGISYIYTKNLWFPIGLHFGWNLFQSLFGFNVSGQDFYSIIEFTVNNPNGINGGKFGFEGSYLSLIAELIILCSVAYLYREKKQLITQSL